MGCNNSHGVVSNATPWEVKYILNEREVEINETTITRHWNVDGPRKEEIRRIEGPNIINVSDRQFRNDNLVYEINPEKPRYLTIWVSHPDKGEIMMAYNIPVKNEQDMRKVIWLEKTYQLKISNVAKEPHQWRFAEGAAEHRNYPSEFKCLGCGENQRCKQNCSEKAKHGGY